MPRDHTDLLRKLWARKDFRALPRSAQALYVQMLTDTMLTAAGVLPLMVDKWAAACDDTTIADIQADLKALIDTGFVIVDAETFEVLLRWYLDLAGLTRHPNHLKGALRAAETVESSLLRKALAIDVLALGLTGEAKAFAEAFAERLIGSGSHPDPIPMPSESVPTPIPKEADHA
ncbi:hypothetical protein ACFXG4_04800 [Nocardia sp. NPDC059246]|uniref:hypothetical protein n=1 Tax=unclassified Nocardia TaxID=2637762 RepID=UPI0036C18E77